MSATLSSLNENQTIAVRWDDGPMLALAGPGSGKTAVLTLRVARLIAESEDSAVLALTFTRKAAEEMRTRVERILGAPTDRARLCTFHRFAQETLVQHGSHVGIQPDFSILTQTEDRIAVLEDVIQDVAPGDRAVPTDRKNVLSVIERLFAEGYRGEGRAPLFKETPAWVPGVFSGYVEALRGANRVDYSVMIHLACTLLREHPVVADAVRLGWTHVCVDEFQDTNKAQYELLQLIAPPPDANLFVVADDDQILFQWNGASPDRLRALTSDYAMQIVQLPENYRCPGEIVDIANKLIVHNQRRAVGKAPLLAAKGPSHAGDVIRYQVYATQEEEATEVAADIRSRGLEPGDCVVLGRSRKIIENFAEALSELGFDVFVAQRKTDFEEPVIRLVFDALRLANAPHDRDALRRLCVAWEELTEEQIEMESVAAASGAVGGSFLRAWTAAVSSSGSTPAQALLTKLKQSLVDRLEFPEVVEWFLREGCQEWATPSHSVLSEELEVWRALHEEVLAGGAANATLHGYLQNMDMVPKTPVPGPQAIRCLTVHGAKGLEFKHVYLTGLAQEVLPSYQALQKGPDSRAVEEERRNCFVAITRTQESLTLTRAQRYFGYGKQPSQFLAEMGLERQ